MGISFMTFACPAWSLEGVLAAAARHGYEGVEIRTDAGHQHGVETSLSAAGRAAARQAFRDAGIELCCLATSLKFIADANVGEQALPLLELAHDLGAPGLRVFGGAPVDGSGLEAGIPLAAERLQALAPRAAEAGVELWVETHDVLSLGADVGRVLDLVRHPAVGAVWDVMHPLRNGESLSATRAALARYIRHVHLHDARLDPKTVDIVPLGQGEIPLADVAALLKEEGFTGYYSGEWFGTQMGATEDEALARFLADTRALLN